MFQSFQFIHMHFSRVGSSTSFHSHVVVERSQLLISRFEQQALLFACSCNGSAASAHASQSLLMQKKVSALLEGHAHAPRVIITNGKAVVQVM